MELGYLTEAEEALFKSEFRHIVHYLRQARMRQELEMLPEPLIYHGPEFFSLMKALTNDGQFDALIEQAQIMGYSSAIGKTTLEEGQG